MLRRLLDDAFSESERADALDGDPPIPERLWEDALHGPLAAFLSRPGKELRSQLVDAAWSFGGGGGPAPPTLCAIIEAIHAGSMIIDDIEDGSIVRRGEPALHREYGVPRALNAGCWLYFWPHALLEQLGLTPEAELRARRLIGRTMLAAHEGQGLDLATVVWELEPCDVPRTVRAIARLKSGALVELGLALGATAAGASADVVDALGAFGRELGVGLQMYDDLGGIIRAERQLKGLEDLEGARATWVWAYLARRASPADYAALRALAARVHAREVPADELAAAMRALLGDRPGAAPRAHLEDALARLASLTPPAKALDVFANVIDRLESAYV